MSRQVVRSAEPEEGRRGDLGGAEGDDYVDRLLKLIPAETVAAYLTLQGILMSSLDGADQQSQLQFWLWGTFIILAVGNIFYLRRSQGVTDNTQYVILSLAFVVWVFSLGGPFATLGFYQPFMGSVLLGLFTFIVPNLYQGVNAG